MPLRFKKKNVSFIAGVEGAAKLQKCERNYKFSVKIKEEKGSAMRYIAVLFVFLMVLLIVGCGDNGGIDVNKPMDQMVVEAAEMSKTKLQKTVEKYETAIADKTAEIEDLKKEIKSIPLKELMGNKARSLKKDLSDIMDFVGILKKQLSVYAKELASK
jgi:cell division protein FtsB